MKAVVKLKGLVDELSLRLAAFALAHRTAYIVVTAITGMVVVALFAAQEVAAQSRSALAREVGEALNPLANLLVGPVAKGLAIIATFAFVALLIAGRFLLAISTLVGAVILGLLATLVTGIFRGTTGDIDLTTR